MIPAVKRVNVSKSLQTKSNDWDVTPLHKLHVTIRKYTNIGIDRSNKRNIGVKISKYPIDNSDVSKISINQYPLEFRCPHLEIKQAQQQAIDRFKMKAENDQYRWWAGATEINKKCSGRKTYIMSDNWEGFCLTCGKYESIIPVWSTDGKNINHYHQIQLQE
jgi:hypothetical protein